MSYHLGLIFKEYIEKKEKSNGKPQSKKNNTLIT